MRKKIIKIGNSAGITLSKPELESYNIKIGDIIELRVLDNIQVDKVLAIDKRNEKK